MDDGANGLPNWPKDITLNTTLYYPMCDIMTKRQKLQIEQSEKRQRLNELLGLDGLADEQRGELDTLTKRMQQLEVQLRVLFGVQF